MPTPNGDKAENAIPYLEGLTLLGPCYSSDVRFSMDAAEVLTGQLFR